MFGKNIVLIAVIIAIVVKSEYFEFQGNYLHGTI